MKDIKGILPNDNAGLLPEGSKLNKNQRPSNTRFFKYDVVDKLWATGRMEGKILDDIEAEESKYASVKAAIKQ